MLIALYIVGGAILWVIGYSFTLGLGFDADPHTKRDAEGVLFVLWPIALLLLLLVYVICEVGSWWWIGDVARFRGRMLIRWVEWPYNLGAAMAKRMQHRYSPTNVIHEQA